MQRFTPGSSYGPRKYYTSSVAVVPPRAAWGQIQAVRERAGDKTMPRWMPHIRIAFPFVGNDEFPKVVEQVKPFAARVQPFTIKLNKLSFTNQKLSSVLFCRPETVPSGSLLDVQRAFEQAFPEHNDLLIKAENGYEPALVLGQVEKERAEQVMNEEQAQWNPIEFPVSEVYLLSRLGDGPMEIRTTIPLGDTEPTGEFPDNFVSYRGFRPRTTPGPSSPHKLFVSNLAWNVDNNGLFEAFRDLGATRAFVVYDRLRDRSKGFGFVEFSDEETQLRALQAAQTRELEGRQILVRVAVESVKAQQAKEHGEESAPAAE